MQERASTLIPLRMAGKLEQSERSEQLERSDTGRGEAGSVVWAPGGSSQGAGGNMNWRCAATQSLVLFQGSDTLGDAILLPGWPCQDTLGGADMLMAGLILGARSAGPCSTGHTSLGFICVEECWKDGVEGLLQ